MRRHLVFAVVATIVAIVAVGAQQREQPSATEDAVATGGNFPLAAKTGQDSNAKSVAPPAAVNQGPFDMNTWKYGPAWNGPQGAKIWNPVKLKLMAGQKVTGGTLFASSYPSTYCAFANAGYDFVWTEMQHDAHNWKEVANMWRSCPHAKAVPGVRVAYTDEREEQHALDAGALVLVVPTVDTVEEATAKIPGVSAVFAASGDLGNFSGFRQGNPDYERAINIVHDAALKAGVRLCGPLAWRDRPDFTCFQAGTEMAAINRGVAAELGNLKDTQGKPEVGPYAAR